MNFQTLDAFPDNDVIPDSVAVQVNGLQNFDLEIGGTCVLRQFNVSLDIWAKNRSRRDDVATVLFELSDQEIVIPLKDFNVQPSLPVIGNVQFQGSPRYVPVREQNRGEQGKFRGLVTCTVLAWPSPTGP
jgi:hypothetical protein